MAGVLNLIGEPGPQADPSRSTWWPTTAGASMHGALGIMMALFARERTGRGQHVDVSYLDTSLALLAATPNMRFFWSDGDGAQARRGLPAGRIRTTWSTTPRTAKHLTIGCTEPWLWENFCKAIKRPDMVKFARKADQFVRAANAEEVAGPRGDRGHHPDPHPGRVVRLPGEGRRVRGEGLRAGRGRGRPAGAGPAT